MLIPVPVAATKSTSGDGVANGAGGDSGGRPRLTRAQLAAERRMASAAREEARAKASEAKKEAQVKAAGAADVAKSAPPFRIRKADVPCVACASKMARKDGEVHRCFVTSDSLGRCEHCLSLKYVC